MQTLKISPPDRPPAEPAPDDAIERYLWSRSFLYDDPSSYRDGVSAALAAVREQLNRLAG